MPDAVVSIGKFISKWQPLVATIVGILVIGVGWGIAWNSVKADTNAMRERIESLEVNIEKVVGDAGSDHDLLIELRTDVKYIKNMLDKITIR